MSANELRIPSSNRPCDWCLGDPDYLRYHDEEWGVPSTDAAHLFEVLILEGAQAGLSWLTILRRREGYRLLYQGFDPTVMARWTSADIQRISADPRIIRHQLKVESAAKNARAWLDLCEATNPVHFLWSFVDGVPQQNQFSTLADLPSQTLVSASMSRALKQRGFSFVGPVICYAFMQAVGMVNDHLVSCPRHDEVKAITPVFSI